MNVLLKAFRKSEIKTIREYLNRMSLIYELDAWYKFLFHKKCKLHKNCVNDFMYCFIFFDL